MPQVMNNTARIYTAEGVRLMPGANTVDADAVKKLEANKGAAARIETGKLVIQKSKPGPKPAAMPKAE